MEVGRISSWSELLAHLIARWAARVTKEQRALVTIESQAVEVGIVAVFDAPWVELVGTLGSSRHISPLFALERNFQVPIGAIALLDGELVIRQRVPLDNLRLADLDVALGSIAWQCAQGMRELRFGKDVTP